MIYRHYKGGLYFSVGFATRFSNEFPANSIEQVAMARYTEATNPLQDEPIAVFAIHDNKTGSTYYAYDSSFIDGVHVLYKGLDGRYWLRPMEMFNGYTDDGVKRFAKIKGEELFDILCNLQPQAKESKI
jgi:hypothetical protein